MRTRRRYGKVRIIAGEWRGRRISFPESDGLRPTPDRVRETLFNWLSPSLPGARVLDLFSGSGILGFEALSRGAATVVAVESNRIAADCLRDSARRLQADGFDVVVADAMRFLDTTRLGPFDVIFIDPPHAAADYDAICAAVGARGLAAPGGFVYLEFPGSRAAVFSPPEGWTRHRSSRGGHLVYQLWRPARLTPD
ncbi:MAG TPA: 16S rRNA (guanine(966)-N(2))-methyltransferase RsmD [Arenicellales bacterium]|nr:16S rRNA (guanine(966)-N(2))-methyltransferase RsmD [Arenicellales bacterium]